MNKTIVLGGGCFWCTEAVYQRLKGVVDVQSGYAGGTVPNPDYWDHADHAEVVKVTYDPNLVSLDTIFDVFLHTHDPTSLNQQGYDKGPQYRSIILADGEEELAQAKQAIKQAQADWTNPIVTIVQQIDGFTVAEDGHQNFYNRYKQQNGYCNVIIDPKLAKFRKRYAQLVKSEEEIAAQ